MAVNSILTVLICLGSVFLCSACSQVTTEIETETPAATIWMETRVPTTTPSPTKTLIPPSPMPVFTSTPMEPLEFIEFPSQVALQGESFYPLDAYPFILEPGYPAQDMTWNLSSGEHITGSISNGVLSAAPAGSGWFGSETLQVETCEPSGRCAEGEIIYTVLDPSAYEDVRVVYVGNSGFLITAGDKKVLIDAFQDGLGRGYVLPGYVQSALVKANPPFDAVDMILVTHNHADHFSPSQASQYMRINPEVVLVSTTQVVEQLGEFGERVIAADPAEGSPVNMEANGILVEAYYLSHGIPSNGIETFNNAYVVTLNGVKLFHTGDNNQFSEVGHFNLAEKQIDLAFIAHFFMSNNSYKRMFENIIDADYLFPIHYEYTVIEFDANQVLFNYPEAVVFNLEMETWVMPKGGH